MLRIISTILVVIGMGAGCSPGPVSSSGNPLPTSTVLPEDDSENQDSAESKTKVEPRFITPFPGITVHPDRREVEIRAVVCAPSEPLEQIVCGPNSREHESLLVIENKASEIHAALLMAGFISGQPGRWGEENGRIIFIPPTGDELDIFVRVTDEEGSTRVQSIREWIHDPSGRESFPPTEWRFGGSLFRENPDWMGPGEHYVADMTGSLIGLVTFGDEMIGFGQEISDLEAVRPTEWYADPAGLPPVDRAIILIIVPYGEKPVG